MQNFNGSDPDAIHDWLMIPKVYGEAPAPGTNAPPADAVAAMMKYNEALKNAGL